MVSAECQSARDLANVSRPAVGPHEDPAVKQRHRRKLFHSTRQTGEIQAGAPVGHLLHEPQAVQIENVELAAGPQHQVGFLEVTMREAFLVQLCNQQCRLSYYGWLRCPAVPKQFSEVNRSRNFFHEQVTSRQNAADSSICHRDGPGSGDSEKLQMVCCAEGAPGARWAEQILRQVLQLAEVESLQHEAVRLAHGGAAAGLQNLRPRFKEFVRPGQYPADRFTEQRETRVPLQSAVLFGRKLAIMPQAAL